MYHAKCFSFNLSINQIIYNPPELLNKNIHTSKTFFDTLHSPISLTFSIIQLYLFIYSFRSNETAKKNLKDLKYKQKFISITPYRIPNVSIYSFPWKRIKKEWITERTFVT